MRLNEKLYIDEDFYQNGIRVYPMEIDDGQVPTENNIVDFLMLAELEIASNNAIAVHCRSGLGRTGCFVASYIMHAHGFDAKMAIAWVRMCRPGSIYGKLQSFLVNVEHHLGDMMYGKSIKHVEKRTKPSMEVNAARPYKHAM